MTLSNSENKTQFTQHAFLVAWGWFGEHIGLPRRFQALHLKQKRYHHTPQTKVLEFLVSLLGGLKHLQDISLAAHPLDKDRAVAEAWGQLAWADYSGISRTLAHLSWEDVRHFGADPVTKDLPGWFKQYNGRQTIEAGIKENKQVFYLHHIKVRSEPAIYLQERFVLFADQALPVKNALDIRKLGVKRQVQVAAHISAQVIRNSEGRML
jgi:hypothetical protein